MIDMVALIILTILIYEYGQAVTTAGKDSQRNESTAELRHYA